MKALKRFCIYFRVSWRGFVVIWKTLRAGEATYPVVEYSAIVNKPDHMNHANRHASKACNYQRNALLVDECREEIEHCLTRCAQELARVEMRDEELTR